MTNLYDAAAIHVFAQSYEFRDPDGMPTDAQRAMIEDAINGYLSSQRESWPEREPGTSDILVNFVQFITARPELVSLLYDVDMLPEQTVTRAGAIRLAAMCEVWKRMEEAEAKLPKPDPTPVSPALS